MDKLRVSCYNVSPRKIAVENHGNPHQTNVTRLNERQKGVFVFVSQIQERLENHKKRVGGFFASIFDQNRVRGGACPFISNCFVCFCANKRKGAKYTHRQQPTNHLFNRLYALS